MGSKSKERTGMEVLRSIASDTLKDQKLKSRVWSDHLFSWGFFAGEESTEDDEFFIWCSIQPGDRIFLLNDNAEKAILTVISVNRSTSSVDKQTIWVMRCADNNLRTSDFSVKESDLFRLSRKFIRM